VSDHSFIRGPKPSSGWLLRRSQNHRSILLSDSAVTLKVRPYSAQNQWSNPHLAALALPLNSFACVVHTQKGTKRRDGRLGGFRKNACESCTCVLRSLSDGGSRSARASERQGAAGAPTTIDLRITPGKAKRRLINPFRAVRVNPEDEVIACANNLVVGDAAYQTAGSI
jgi:hypothetical protein